MAVQRRDLLLSALPLGGALLWGGTLQAVVSEQGRESQPFDQDAYQFWTSTVSEPSRAFAEHGRFVSKRGVSLPSEAEFLYYSKDTGFVRAASTESDTPLTKTLLERGDASLLLSVDNIRPSNGHLRKIIDQKNGSLKVDLKQAVPMQQLSETLNWSAIASMFPGDKSLGGFHYISFDPKSTWGQATKVPLVSGVGFWAWNFSTQSKPSVWTQMMSLLAGKKPPESSSSSTTSSSVASPATSRSSRASSVSKLAGRAVLGLGFPAIAETAFSAFGELFGSMFSQGSAKNEWIIHNADTPLLATQEARQKHPGHAIALRSGAYMVTSADSTQALLSGKYQLRDGVVVPIGTTDADLDEAARATLPEVSYIALSTVVQPIG